MSGNELVPVIQADREAMALLEQMKARSSGIPLKLIRPKIDAILAGDFDKSPEARAFARCRIASSAELLEALEGMVHRWQASHQNWTQAAVDAQSRGRDECVTIRNTALQALSDFPIESARAAISKAKGETNTTGGSQ